MSFNCSVPYYLQRKENKTCLFGLLLYVHGKPLRSCHVKTVSYLITLYCPPIFTLDLPYMHEYITRSLHIIFNHRKDILYRRSSSILISVIRISYCKITYYECPFNIQRRLDLGEAYVTIPVKVSGSSLGKLFYPRFFILIKKNRHEEHKRMI